MEKARLIEAYLDGTLSQEEQQKFEKSMNEDKELAKEVALSREINEAIRDEGTIQFRKLVRYIIKTKSNRFGTIIRALKIPAAAVILLLISVSIWRIVSTTSPSELYTSFYQPYPTDTSVRSAVRPADNMNMAYKLYGEGNYKASFNILQNHIKEENNDLTAHFYVALNAVELGLYNVAIDEFRIVENDPSSPLLLHARWYLAMTYLRLDQPVEAKKYLEMLTLTENMYSAKAKVALKKLRPKYRF